MGEYTLNRIYGVLVELTEAVNRIADAIERAEEKQPDGKKEEK